ncbi:MAG: flavodoxin domain-containing protein, partial [Candidatus Njordarchaeales archaeon]
ALKKLSGLEIRIIAPSHGPIWRREPSKIVSLYEKLSKYEAEDKVLIIYGSMYGFTGELAEHIAKKLAKEGVRVELHDAVNEHPSYALSKAWDSKIIIFGAPTYENIASPPVYYIVYLLTIKKLKNRYCALFGSSGWAGGGYKQIQKMLDQLGWEVIEPVIEVRGAIKKRGLEKVNELVENIKRKLK